MDFLINNGLAPETLDAPQILRDFIDEMKRGLRGEGTLPMLPAGFVLKQCSPRNCTVPAFDVGGTNVRSARVVFDATGKATFENLIRGKMPGTHGTVDTQTFYRTLSEVLRPNLNPTERFGFCFSYPITEDGTLLFWTKKIQAPTIPGRNVTEDLLQTLTEQRCPKCSARILNDTVATLIAAYTHASETDAAGHVGFILGTGTNTAYTEATDRILKRRDLPKGEMMPINCESGNFTRFPRSTFDTVYEQRLGTSKAQWERTFSGVHLGSLGTILLRQAAEAGYVPSLRDTLLAHEFDHVTLDRYCSGADTACLPCATSEWETVRDLLLPLYERAALFAAINIAAAAVCSAHARGQHEGVIHVNADGSTFWKTAAIPFAERVTQHVQTLLSPYHLTAEIFCVDNAPLLGAALAALN